LKELPDNRLENAIRAREREALAEYMEKKRSVLLALIRRNMSASLARKVDPQDVLQEVAIHAFNGLAEVDLTRVSPYAWLCRLAEQRIIDAHRRYFSAGKRSAHVEVGLYDPRSADHSGAFADILVASLTTPTQFIARDEKTRALLEQFERLSPEVREALSLRYVNGLSLQDIARKLGKSEGSVRVMLSRGVKKLKVSMEKD